MEVYSKIIETFQILLDEQSAYWDAGIRGLDEPEEADELWARSEEARRNLYRLAELNSFLVDGKINSVLWELKSRVEKVHLDDLLAVPKGLERHEKIVPIVKYHQIAFAKIKRIARKDLGLRPLPDDLIDQPKKISWEM